jgi:putrescine transport system ATP-binding protein
LSVVVAVRPEKIVLSKKRPAGEVNWCVGEVVALVYFGDHTIYHIQLANAQVIKAQQMNRTTDLAEAITSGDRVYASWSGLALVVLVQ